MDDELIGEIRALLKNGQVPVRVSNRMLWAAFAEHYKMERRQMKQMGRNTVDIKVYPAILKKINSSVDTQAITNNAPIIPVTIIISEIFTFLFLQLYELIYLLRGN